MNDGWVRGKTIEYNSYFLENTYMSVSQSVSMQGLVSVMSGHEQKA